MDTGNKSPFDSNSNRQGSNLFKQKTYETSAEKKKDFWRGFGLWWGLNILLALCSWGLTALVYSFAITPDGPVTPYYDIYSNLSCILGTIPLVINIGLMIYLAFTRSQMALGMLAAFGVALFITICLGVIFTVWCFYALGNSGL